ncbi:MAG: GNAT family N-acetyltransferase [Dongiaceae bacterium]
MKKAKPIKIDVWAAEVADFEALARLYGDRNAHSQTLQLPFPSLELWRKRLTQQDDAHHVLVVTVAGEVVGNLGLTRLARPRRAHAGEFGMAVRDRWQGNGVGTALIQAALDLANNWLGLRRVELSVSADNDRAIRLYRKFGFEIEGTHRAGAAGNPERTLERSSIKWNRPSDFVMPRHGPILNQEGHPRVSRGRHRFLTAVELVDPKAKPWGDATWFRLIGFRSSPSSTAAAAWRSKG